MCAESHPRPQLIRERWSDLCGVWQFAFDDDNVGLRENWAGQRQAFERTITVPFPPESPASGIGDRAPHPIVWYRRTFKVTPEDRRQRLLLHFGAVDYRAQVWVNGHLIAHHEGGHTPFSADIAPVLRTDVDEQVVVVRAEDQPADLAQPRGKQYWGDPPDEVWYHRTTGIWQPVWLEPVPETYIADVRWTPDLDRAVLGLQVTLDTPPPRPLVLRVRLTLRGRPLADDAYVIDRMETRREIAVEVGVPSIGRNQRLLWSPEYPNLIDAAFTLEDGGRTIDIVHSYVGLRSISIADGRFVLNGWPYYLRLVLNQGYWPQSHLAAPSNQALRREVELVKELGFNGVRVHQKIEDPRFLYWCDRLGLLVWGEMPSAYVFSPIAVERLTREWLEVVRRDYSHPSIAMWVPFNESWGVSSIARDPAQRAYVRTLYYLTHALDPTRPVIGNDGWEHIASDIWGIHDYALDGATLRERYGTPEAVERTIREIQPYYRAIALFEYHPKGQPVMLTECGGISYAPAMDALWFGYGTVPDANAFIAKYEELIGTIVDCPTISGFCYTQLTDVEHESNGLLAADRTPKAHVAAIRAITTRYSKAIPGELIIANILTAADVSGSAEVDHPHGEPT